MKQPSIKIQRKARENTASLISNSKYRGCNPNQKASGDVIISVRVGSGFLLKTIELVR